MNRLSLLGATVAAALLALAPSCLERQTDDRKANLGRCASCHGDANRSGDYLQRAAPPKDLLGDSSPSYPGVGAHSNHVYASETHAPVLCNECHVVPVDIESKGHTDSREPAEISFGALAKTGSHAPSYDAESRRCSDSYCHRDAKTVWTEPRSSKDACGSCHGLPPPAPHPQSERCSACHGEVVDADRRIIAPELHVNGKVDLALASCTTCHGSGDNPAPPVDTLGNDQPSAIGVGAHQIHLAGGSFSRPVECNECHTVPQTVDAPGHADALPAEVLLTGVAATDGRTPTWSHELARCSDSWCHGPSPNTVSTSPNWTAAASLACTSCHGTPPVAPHPQISDCSRCHSQVVADDDVTIINRNLHVDGMVEVSFDQSCTSCHGGQNPAPPVDLSGSSSTSSPGVGAHQTHLAGSATARSVPCGDCHVVPSTPLASGHLDSSLPAELTFSGAANAFGGNGSYSSGTCQNLACHGGAFPDGHASGGTNTTPIWTKVDKTQATCGSCHSLPPPAPHPVASLNPVCSACHEDIAADNMTFTKPELHVDGIVTFTVP